ncbi:hypothetical protein LZ554_007114 [Drepanopeziza brunnea f. sp. 'monogermtubi']|nr:hypothetical protein LZ554_007114 [Drepanopeziza brunnea f. sp. 'monogermtubi']
MDEAPQEVIKVGQVILKGKSEFPEWFTDYTYLVKSLRMDTYALPRTGVQEPAYTIEDDKPKLLTVHQKLQEANASRDAAYNQLQEANAARDASRSGDYVCLVRRQLSLTKNP